jgi:uncharacterized protein YqjF (DUF2071 family)
MKPNFLHTRAGEHVELKLQSPECRRARERLFSNKGDPFVFADWQSALFLHFLISPELLKPHVPAPFRLELYRGQACVSVVALTMRNFRGRSPLSLGSLFRVIETQRFLNLRTYVHYRDEPGALFLWGWLSSPFGLPLPMRWMGLPFAFADIEHDYEIGSGTVKGNVTSKHVATKFEYHACIDQSTESKPCVENSLSQFALERYSGFFSAGRQLRAFRTWHPTWLLREVEITTKDTSLITNQFSWFQGATFREANFSPGISNVEFGCPHRLESVDNHRSTLSAFYEVP